MINIMEVIDHVAYNWPGYAALASSLPAFYVLWKVATEKTDLEEREDYDSAFEEALGRIPLSKDKLKSLDVIVYDKIESTNTEK